MGSSGVAARSAPDRSLAGASGESASSSRAPAPAILENSRALSLRAMVCLSSSQGFSAAPGLGLLDGQPARVQSSTRRKRYRRERRVCVEEMDENVGAEKILSLVQLVPSPPCISPARPGLP